MMTTGRDALSKAETVIVAAIESEVPALVQAREIIDAFHQMLRRKATATLPAWIEQARLSLVASFANGVAKDELAVPAAISSPWSNGQAEGQITELKLVNARCTAERKSTCSRPASSVRPEQVLQRKCVRPNLRRLLTGMAGPADRSSRPHGLHRPTPDETIEQIVALRRQRLSRSSPARRQAARRIFSMREKTVATSFADVGCPK
jgi:hypothetical protein